MGRNRSNKHFFLALFLAVIGSCTDGKKSYFFHLIDQIDQVETIGEDINFPRRTQLNLKKLDWENGYIQSKAFLFGKKIGKVEVKRFPEIIEVEFEYNRNRESLIQNNDINLRNGLTAIDHLAFRPLIGDWITQGPYLLNSTSENTYFIPPINFNYYVNQYLNKLFIPEKIGMILSPGKPTQNGIFNFKMVFLTLKWYLILNP